MGLVPIDSPILDNLSVTLFDQPVPDTPQIAQFIDRTPKLKAPMKHTSDPSLIVRIFLSHFHGHVT